MSENPKSEQPESMMWIWKVNTNGEVTKGEVAKNQDLTDEERVQVREGLRRERRPFSSSMLASPALDKDWVEQHSSHEVALTLSARDTTKVMYENAHRYLEERLMHALRERDVLEHNLRLAEKKAVYATTYAEQLENHVKAWQKRYNDLVQVQRVPKPRVSKKQRRPRSR